MYKMRIHVSGRDCLNDHWIFLQIIEFFIFQISRTLLSLSAVSYNQLIIPNCFGIGPIVATLLFVHRQSSLKLMFKIHVICAE